MNAWRASMSEHGTQDMNLTLACTIAVDGEVLIRSGGSIGCRAKINLDEPQPEQPSA